MRNQSRIILLISAKSAARENVSVVFVHSHPGSAPPEFSRTDDRGEIHLANFLSVRAPSTKPVAVVVSAGGWRARCLGNRDAGTDRFRRSPNCRICSIRTISQEARFPEIDRQVRALGAAGQKHLESLTVAIVGVGGTGSIAAEQLAYLGVRKFILIDPDSIDITNLNPVVGARASDVGRFKTDVTVDMIARIVPDSDLPTNRRRRDKNPESPESCGLQILSSPTLIRTEVVR